MSVRENLQSFQKTMKPANHILFFLILLYAYGHNLIFLTLLTLALITYRDLKSIEDFKDKTVLAIKAPPQTRLEVPDPQEVCCINNDNSATFSS